jgi:hypothetical protein
MNSSATTCAPMTSTGGKAPRKALKVFPLKRTTTKSSAVNKDKTVKNEKAAPTAITTEGGEKDLMVIDRVEQCYGRKRTIEDIMSSEAAADADSSAPAPVGKRQICRKRKAVPKGITSVPSSSSSSSSSSSEDDDCKSGDEADIQDATDVLDYQSQGTVITSTVKYPESESSSSSDDDWEAKCACPDGTVRRDCTCECDS